MFNNDFTLRKASLVLEQKLRVGAETLAVPAVVGVMDAFDDTRMYSIAPPPSYPDSSHVTLKQPTSRYDFYTQRSPPLDPSPHRTDASRAPSDGVHFGVWTAQVQRERRRGGAVSRLRRVGARARLSGGLVHLCTGASCVPPRTSSS